MALSGRTQDRRNLAQIATFQPFRYLSENLRGVAQHLLALVPVIQLILNKLAGKRMKLGYIAVIASLGPALLMPGSAFSQSITLTSPSNTVNVADGDDYATDVLKQGWNMNRIRDVAYEDGFFQPAIVNGVWEATTSSTTAYIEPLFPGFNEPAYTMCFSRYDAIRSAQSR